MEQSLSSSIAKEVWRLAVQVAMDSLASDTGDSDGRRHALPPDMALQMFRRRLAALECGMTPRELDVCARTLIGMTAEGIALDLNVKKSSVSTYRKRAYARLGISSQSQLYRLLM